jgi:hypothetical protein
VLASGSHSVLHSLTGTSNRAEAIGLFAGEQWETVLFALTLDSPDISRAFGIPFGVAHAPPPKLFTEGPPRSAQSYHGTCGSQLIRALKMP